MTTLCRVSGIAACLLLLSWLLLPAIAAAQPRPPSDCEKVLHADQASGQTIQQRIDTAFRHYALESDTLPEAADEAQAAQLHFDALCRMDARLGTQEGMHFFDEETARAGRILQALQTLQARHDRQAKPTGK